VLIACLGRVCCGSIASRSALASANVCRNLTSNQAVRSSWSILLLWKHVVAGGPAPAPITTMPAFGSSRCWPRDKFRLPSPTTSTWRNGCPCVAGPYPSAEQCNRLKSWLEAEGHRLALHGTSGGRAERRCATRVQIAGASVSTEKQPLRGRAASWLRARVQRRTPGQPSV
jgi:hypothetical protein